jgi:excinuclease ABC subunit C
MPDMSTAPRAVIASLPGGPGVYRFRDVGGRALYIGRAVDLRRRVGSYWTDLRDRRHLVRMVPQIVGIEAVACDSAHEAAWLERNLLERSKPRWNRIRGGTEVPVYIRLDRRPGWARLAVVHRPPLDQAAGTAGSAVDLFGPYLGGTKARLAVSALDRVLPLRYTDDRLSGGQRDLARVRGVEAADRDVLLATVTAVLHRQPAAVETVKDQLVRQRDRASDSLAFELAARIQQEIEAVDWVVAEQKVTMLYPTTGPSAPGLGPADCDVYGWADGLLVHFEVRHGRLCAWKQRTCPPVEARQYLDLTPAGWRTFAARSAELARRLADAGTGQC